MNEAELAQYCRGKGLFVEQVADWREACQQANAAADAAGGADDVQDDVGAVAVQLPVSAAAGYN